MEHHGAIAVFISDNLQFDNAESLVDMIHDGTTREVSIPAGFILGSDGYCILLMSLLSFTSEIFSLPQCYFLILDYLFERGFK